MVWFYSPVVYGTLISLTKNLRFRKWKKYLKDRINLVTLKKIRKINNILLSIFSGGMTFFSALEIREQLKDYTADEIVCKQFTETENLYLIMKLFYLSKYWEWLDTIFLVIFNKHVSNLHYYHHASTPFLSYITVFYQGIVPSYIYACLLNCFVHTFMYWYYAYPLGFLNKYKKWITKIQIIQHTYILLSLSYIYLFCNEVFEEFYIPILVSLICYGYYFVQFTLFYVNKYRVTNN